MNKLVNQWLGAILGGAIYLGSTTVVFAAKLYEPPPTEWGCTLSEKRVLQGINAGLLGRGWVVTSNDGQGKLVAQVVVRGKHTLVVDIAYDTRSFDISYKNSNNVDYRVKSNGTEVIHRNANSWMQNIQNDIAAQLAALCVLDQ